MRTLGNIVWHFPFLGFITAGLTFLFGALLVLTVVAAPIGLGLMELGKFLFKPFGSGMVSKSDLNVRSNRLWDLYSTVVMVLYFPFGLLLCLVTVVQIGLLFLSIVGIPVALVLAKSLGTFLNPVHKKCVPMVVVDEIARRKGEREVERWMGK
jgi:uncharacterized membrane protein YccF (DUF307 family)